MEIIEQQAIRAALALAVASAHARTPESIVDMREEAVQLIGLCIHDVNDTIPFLAWCDTAVELLERISRADAISEQEALRVSAAILRLRLVVARYTKHKESSNKAAAVHKKKSDVHGRQKLIIEFVTSHPDVRTKDLISGLSKELSVRTIKRCLKDLLDTGMLQRTKSDDGGVSYHV